MASTFGIKGQKTPPNIYAKTNFKTVAKMKKSNRAQMPNGETVKIKLKNAVKKGYKVLTPPTVSG